MNKKTSFLFIWLLILLSATNNALATQNVGVFSVNDGRFVCNVSAPREAKTGEDFYVAFLIRPWATLDVDTIRVKIYGPIGYDGEWTEWNYTWKDRTMYLDTEYRAEKNFFVRSLPASVGELYGDVYAVYDCNGRRYVTYVNFKITEICTKTYEQMENDYNSLNHTYQNLQNENNSLKSGLNFYQNLAIAFIITTIALAFTTIYFARKKSKVKTS